MKQAAIIEVESKYITKKGGPVHSQIINIIHKSILNGKALNAHIWSGANPGSNKFAEKWDEVIILASKVLKE